MKPRVRKMISVPKRPIDRRVRESAAFGSGKTATVLDRVMPRRAVILRATHNGQSREYVEAVPAEWDAEMIRFARNEGGWCAGNLYGDLRACGVDTDWLPPEDEDGPCLCGDVEIEYVRDATAEEAARIKP